MRGKNKNNGDNKTDAENDIKGEQRIEKRGREKMTSVIQTVELVWRLLEPVPPCPGSSEARTQRTMCVLAATGLH